MHTTTRFYATLAVATILFTHAAHAQMSPGPAQIAAGSSEAQAGASAKYSSISVLMSLHGCSEFSASSVSHSALPPYASVTITKVIDKCSPLLYEITVNGRRIPYVEITMRDFTSGHQVRATLTNAVITSITHSASAEETVHFSYEKIEFFYQ